MVRKCQEAEETSAKIAQGGKLKRALKAVSSPHKEPESAPANSPDMLQKYLKEVRKIPLLTKEEEIHYATLAQAGDEDARHKMIESNLRLVVKIARRYMNSDLHLSDLIEEGNLGLMHAVEKFDPQRGFRFSTYAAWWIQQNIERAIINQSRTVRIPVHVAKKMNRFFKTQRELTKELKHEPSIVELSEALARPTEDIEFMLTLREKILSVDFAHTEYSDKTMLDTLEDENCQNPSVNYMESNISDKLIYWLSNLSTKHKQVIISRYGLLGTEPKTLDETSLEVGLTRERVRQLQAEALILLKKHIHQDGENISNLLS